MEAPTPEAIALEIARNDVGACLTPSSIAAEMRPDLDPAEAAAIYTGAEPWHARLQLLCTRPLDPHAAVPKA